MSYLGSVMMTRPPSPIARRFMGEIEENPAYWQRRVAESVVKSTSLKSEG